MSFKTLTLLLASMVLNFVGAILLVLSGFAITLAVFITYPEILAGFADFVADLSLSEINLVFVGLLIYINAFFLMVTGNNTLFKSSDYLNYSAKNWAEDDIKAENKKLDRK